MLYQNSTRLHSQQQQAAQHLEKLSSHIDAISTMLLDIWEKQGIQLESETFRILVLTRVL